MGRNDGITKPSVELGSTVAGIKSHKAVDESEIKAYFHATIERLLSGKEIIKVAHRDPLLDKPNTSQNYKFRFQDLLSEYQLPDGDVPGWLLKVYENLQPQKDHSKGQSSWLLQHFKGDKKEIQPPPFHSIDIRDSDTSKITANEAVRLIDSCLSLKKFDADPKLPSPIKVQILQEKLHETLLQVKLLLTERPNGWDDTYAAHVTTIKDVVHQLEEFFLEMETSLSKEPVFDLKIKTMTVFALNAKQNLLKFKRSLQQWDSLTKIVLETDNKFPVNDDIILVERKGSGAIEPQEGKDEL